MNQPYDRMIANEVECDVTTWLPLHCTKCNDETLHEVDMDCTGFEAFCTTCRTDHSRCCPVLPPCGAGYHTPSLHAFELRSYLQQRNGERCSCCNATIPSPFMGHSYRYWHNGEVFCETCYLGSSI